MKRWVVALLCLSSPVAAQPAPLKLDSCVVAVRPGAGDWEQKAALELLRVLTSMTGHKPELQTTLHPQAKGPLLVVGELALQLKPELRRRLTSVARPHPVLRADAVTLLRQGSVVYLAGNNDESHYFAVMQLLHRWGCRWYMPTSFGECIPSQPDLSLGDLDQSYAPPFEVRTFWISWNGDYTGYQEFLHHNFMNTEAVENGHALSAYVGDLQTAGGLGNFSITAPETALHVADKVAPKFAKGERFSLGMEDGSYASQSPGDLRATGELQDKFFGVPALSDAFLIFYNEVCRLLQSRYPQSHSKIGFLAYINLTLPPQRNIHAAAPLVAYLAPIDIDPNHGIGDPRSPEMEDFAGALQRWSRVMDGRVVIYDYDQGMLVWRDIPDPSQQAVQANVQAYRKAGILGISTESRNAVATTFTNLFFRGQLYWNPDLSVETELNDFYPRFFGSLAAPMQAYWSQIFAAWKHTDVTEHEYFAAPVIYTEPLMASLARAFALIPSGSLPEPYASRLRFTQLSHQVLEGYLSMVELGARDCAYRQAYDAGKRALAAREELTKMNGIFTTYRNYPENGPAFFPGDVASLAELATLTDGPRGLLVARSPLLWRYDPDPYDEGLWRGWGAKNPSGPGQSARTDVYLQGQGLSIVDRHSQEAYGWYSTELPLTAEQANGELHLCFPGLFNECWLYVNGSLVEHRAQKPLWWLNDYSFRWDCNLTGLLHAGPNRVAVRITTSHHFSGMFRRPFLYRSDRKGKTPSQERCSFTSTSPNADGPKNPIANRPLCWTASEKRSSRPILRDESFTPSASRRSSTPGRASRWSATTFESWHWEPGGVVRWAGGLKKLLGHGEEEFGTSPFE